MGSSMDEIQHRLQEVLVQLGNEITIFERLMYKNTNQHRRALYFRRLRQVRRDLRLLQSADVNELAQNSAQYLRKKFEQDVPGNAFQSRFVVSKKMIPDSAKVRALRRRLFGVARLLVQMSEPLLIASSQVAGLLGQTFFMPFALTAFSALARFRVLLQQVLCDTVLIFNMLSAQQFEKAANSSDNVKESIRFDTKAEAAKVEKMPDSLDCTWDGGKVFLCCKFIHQLERKTDGDVMQSFMEDHKSRRYDVSSSLHSGDISLRNGGASKDELGKSAGGSLQFRDLMMGEDRSCFNYAASILNASSAHGQVAPIRYDNLVEKLAENITDFCSNEEKTQCMFHVAVSNQATDIRDTLKENDVHDGSTVSTSGIKRKVAYISIDIKPVEEVEEQLDKPREENTDSQKQNKESLFDMLVGLRRSEDDTIF